MATKNYSIDRVNEKLIITKVFERKANEYGSAEYILLKNLMDDYPRYRIVIDESNSKKKTYSALSYKKMEKYINEYCSQCGETVEEICKRVKELKNVIELSRLRPGSYGYTKHWFLNKYPSYKEMDIPEVNDNSNDDTTNEKEAA